MSTHVKASELKAGQWYMVRQGSVLIPMRLDSWYSKTEVSMFTRKDSPRRVSVLNIADGYDPDKGELFELPKDGELTASGGCHCPGCRLCQSNAAAQETPSKPVELKAGSKAVEVLQLLDRHRIGLSDTDIEDELSDHTPASLRGVRADLVRGGYAVDSAERVRTPSGRKARVWRISTAGVEALQQLEIPA